MAIYIYKHHYCTRVKKVKKGLACQQERRSKTLDLHNEELLLVLSVSVQMIHQKTVMSQNT